jgi:hypothetical protein
MDDAMSFEFFKGFPPDRDTPVVELNVRHGDTVDIPAEIRRERGQIRIAIFAREGGIAWDYPVAEWIDAIQRAVVVLGDD